MTKPDPSLRILTNMAFWQCEDFADATDSIYDLEAFKANPVYRSQIWEAWQLYRRARTYDVVHTMNIRASMFYAILCKLTFRRPKQIMTEVFFDLAQPSHWKWRLKTRIYRWAAQGCWGVICNSGDEVTVTHERLGLPMDRIHYLPLYSNIRKPRMAPEKNGVVLSAGRSLRDYDTLLAAAPHIDAPVHIIRGSDDLKGRDLPANVTIMRELPYDTYLEHIKACSIVALPLEDTVRSTGQVVMLTAMGLGKPVVTSDAPGTRDYLRSEENGLLVPKKDPDALAQAVNRLLAEPDFATRLAEQALEETKDHYTIVQHGRARLEIIYKLIEGTA